jgi:hypothetical protein
VGRKGSKRGYEAGQVRAIGVIAWGAEALTYLMRTASTALKRRIGRVAERQRSMNAEDVIQPSCPRKRSEVRNTCFYFRFAEDSIPVLPCWSPSSQRANSLFGAADFPSLCIGDCSGKAALPCQLHAVKLQFSHLFPSSQGISPQRRIGKKCAAHQALRRNHAVSVWNGDRRNVSGLGKMSILARLSRCLRSTLFCA